MSVSGWAGVASTMPGTVDLYLDSPTPVTVDLQVRRVGGQEKLSLPGVAVTAQAGPPWTVTTTVTIPAGWPSGYYQVVQVVQPAATLDQAIAGFVVRPVTAGLASKILLSVDMLTNRGYAQGYYASPRIDTVSFDTPGGLPDTRELRLHVWLEQEGIVVECCAAQDLELPETTAPYDCLVVAGHAEYWSRAMRDSVAGFVAAGGNLICLSGNTCFRQVRLEGNGRTMVCKKFPGSDSARGFDATVAFADPPVNRPPNQLLGVGWTHAAFGATVSAPYHLRFPGHWAMAGVSDTTTGPFLSYETDAASYVEEDEGYPRVTGEDGTSVTFVPLATAELPGWIKPGYATAGTFRRGGTIFVGGSTDWCTALLDVPGFLAGPALKTITRNVFRRLGARADADWEHIGHANEGRAMAAVGGRLFLATAQNRLWRRFPIGAEVPWRAIGHANHVVAMASDGSALFAITADGKLWWRASIEWNVNWTAIDTAPAGAKTLACAGGTLYAFDGTGALLARPAAKAAASWRSCGSVPGRTDVVALTSHADILFAVTEGGRLLRTNSDWIFESWAWVDVHHCYFATALAVIDGTMFVCTSENKLWMLDLHGLRMP
jgi:outer membrane protein assembly factor BamB